MCHLCYYDHSIYEFNCKPWGSPRQSLTFSGQNDHLVVELLFCSIFLWALTWHLTIKFHICTFQGCPQASSFYLRCSLIFLIPGPWVNSQTIATAQKSISILLSIYVFLHIKKKYIKKYKEMLYTIHPFTCFDFPPSPLTFKSYLLIKH